MTTHPSPPSDPSGHHGGLPHYPKPFPFLRSPWRAPSLSKTLPFPQVTMEGSLTNRFEALEVLLPVTRSRLSAMIRQRPTLLTRSIVGYAQV